MMASMTNGSGDEYFILFDEAGAAIKGFDHESKMSPWCNDDRKIWPGVLEEVPAEFKSFLNEPAFSMKDITFCIWRNKNDAEWQTGKIVYPEGEDPDGSLWMLSILTSGPEEYKTYAREYFERDIPLSAVEHIYQHKKINSEFVRSLNSEVIFEELMVSLAEIGYPF